ncbi:ABC transporter substrate-binding protein [Chitinimonas lacunae]|uniref:ABC transporter substrate-binding protein n=1 Tax=Chitinimonas lacunae TaxID=1963018 RepID=A0ABV8MQ63_9NEIS
MRSLPFRLSALALVCGQVCAADLVVGSVNPMSGVMADMGNELMWGARAAFEAVNAQGGVNGNRLVLLAKDGGYRPAEAAAVVKNLIEQDKPIALIAIAGTSINEEILNQKLLNHAQIPHVGPLSGGAVLRRPINPYLYNVRASYRAEASRLVKQALTMGATKIAMFYQNDDFGLDGLNSVEAELKKHNMKVIATGSYETGADDVRAAVSTIAKAGPDAVIMFSADKTAAAFMRGMRQHNSTANFYAASLVNHRILIQQAGLNNVQNLVISQVVPSPNNLSKPIVKEYRDALKRHIPEAKPSYFGLESYIAAKVLIEGLKRAGPSPTRQSLQKALDGIGRYNAGGFELTFGPNDREGSEFVDIAIVGADGEFRQ